MIIVAFTPSVIIFSGLAGRIGEILCHLFPLKGPTPEGLHVLVGVFNYVLCDSLFTSQMALRFDVYN